MKTQPGKALKHDMTPKSGGHIARLVFGTIMVLAGVAVIIGHIFGRHEAWSTHEVILTLGLTGGGLGVMFTETMLELLKAIPFPWRKS